MKAELHNNNSQWLARARQQTKDLADNQSALVLGITRRLIEKYGDELFPHGYAMTGPTHRIGNIVLEAKSRKLSTRVVLSNEEPFDLEKEIARAVEGIYGEFKRELSAPSSYFVEAGQVIKYSAPAIIVPYILITSSGVVTSPETNCPTISFLTRYAIIDALPENVTPGILETLMGNAEHAVARANSSGLDTSPGSPATLSQIVMRASDKFIENHVEELFPHGLYLTKSAEFVAGWPANSRPHTLQSKWMFEASITSTPPTELAEEAIIDCLVKEIKEEYKVIIAEAAGKNQQIIPHIILDTSGIMVDPATFQPVMRFVTWYATIG